MKNFIRSIVNLALRFNICIVKLKAKILGDYIINKYIENCSERFLAFSLKEFGVQVALNANIKRGLILDNTYRQYTKLHIGDNCFIGRKVFFDLADEIFLEKDSVVSEGVSIITHQDVGKRMISEFYKRKQAKVVIKEGAFIGANVTVLCGVTIGKCAVVGAGAVVTKDIPDYFVVAGVPAKFIKKLKN